MAVSQKTGDQCTSRPNIITLWHIPKECSIKSQENLFNYVHSSIICNSQKLEPTEMPLNQRIDKENVVHSLNGSLLCCKIQQHHEIFRQMELEKKILSEVTQIQNDKPSMNTLINGF